LKVAGERQAKGVLVPYLFAVRRGPLRYRSKGKTVFPMTKRHESGFSMIELVIVLAIFLIVVAIGLPSIRQVLGGYRLNASARDVASLLQQARMAAVQANQPYYVTFDANNEVVAVPASRFGPPPAPINSDPTTTPAAGVVFNAGPPSTATLDAAVGATPPPNVAIGFNGRGMPCVQTVSPWVCAGGPTAFEWFMQSNVTQAWVAVTVTPSGHIKSWRLNSSSTWM
jgi:prepilin-type N-terminal cleavage/methylation domain-containing protein